MDQAVEVVEGLSRWYSRKRYRLNSLSTVVALRSLISDDFLIVQNDLREDLAILADELRIEAPQSLIDPHYDHENQGLNLEAEREFADRVVMKLFYLGKVYLPQL